MHRSFATTLKDHGLILNRENTTTLQVNVGLRCNLSCKHCHLYGGPGRTEMMTPTTMDDVIAFARRNSFQVADITGGAPEMLPDLGQLIEGLNPLVESMMLRSNLLLLVDGEHNQLLETLIRNRVTLVASFPSINERQTDGQRGQGVWKQCINNLKKLNELGYGIEGKGLDLMLISNPSGAFMPTDQCQAEKKFKADMARKWGIQFTSLYTFANIPLGRFKDWLDNSGNTDQYMSKLCNGFNPGTIDNLMCRHLVSISWDGYLYDCDFNQAAGLHLSSKPLHVSEVETLPEDLPIVTDMHCYGCTAGSGFT